MGIIKITPGPGTWELVNSPGTSIKIVDGNPTVKIPIGTHTGPELGYMTKQVGKTGKVLVLECSWDIEPGTVVRQSIDPEQDKGQDPLATPTFGLYLQRKDLDLWKEHHRYWNSTRFEIKPGLISHRVELDHKNFTNVWGRGTAKGFADCVKNLDRIGLTFGGGGDYGHGVHLKKGKAKLTILRIGFDA